MTELNIVVHHSRNNLFETEKNKAQGEDFFPSDERETEILPNSRIARKSSLLPKGNPAKYSKIPYFKKYV